MVTLCPEKNVNLAHTYTLVGRVPDPPIPHPGTPIRASQGCPDRGSDPPSDPPIQDPGMAIPGSRIPLPDRPGTPPREGPGPSPGGSRNPSPEGPESVPEPLPGQPGRIGRKPGIGRFPRKRPKLVSSADFETGNSRPWGIAHGGVGTANPAIPDPPRNPSPDPPLGLPDRVVIGLPGPSWDPVPGVPEPGIPGPGIPG